MNSIRHYLDLITFSPEAQNTDSTHKFQLVSQLTGLPGDITPIHLMHTRDIDICVLCHALNRSDLANNYLKQQYGSSSMAVLVDLDNAVSEDSALWAEAVGFNRRGSFYNDIRNKHTLPFTPEVVPWLVSLSVSKVRQLLVASTIPKVNKAKEATLKQGVQNYV